MPLPDISVIIPNYNHAAFLSQRIESVLSQTYRNFELILLDDYSTDNSWTILSSYKSHPFVKHILRNKKNSGSPFAQWKKGLQLATGKYIWIAESDDWAEPDFLETLVPMLEKGNALAYCRSNDVDEKGLTKSHFFWADGLDDKRWKEDFENEGTCEIDQALKYRCTIPNASSCVFLKSAAPLGCGFDKMRYCGDWLFWIELLRYHRLAYTSKVLNHFRHSSSSTRNRKSDREEQCKTLEIINIIEHARKIAKTQELMPDEYRHYDWVVKGFYRKLLVPKATKHKIIFYINRHYPGVYDAYRDMKTRVLK